MPELDTLCLFAAVWSGMGEEALFEEFVFVLGAPRIDSDSPNGADAGSYRRTGKSAGEALGIRSAIGNTGLGVPLLRSGITGCPSISFK